MNYPRPEHISRQISIIIPTLNEAKHIGLLLDSIMNSGFGGEIIVVDGMSGDETVSIARKYAGVQVFHSDKRGRGYQLHFGAQKASGKYYLFLHADSRYSRPALSEACARIASNEAVVALYCLEFDASSAIYRQLGALSRMNHPLTNYGDQGLLISRDIYQKIGGYQDIPILEDVDILRRARTHCRITKFQSALVTSARRFERKGVWKQLMINGLILTGYYLGIPPKRLASLYR